ncbi:galactose-1-phosphate uridylyltransferase [Litorilinea aerophila]|uniref:Galactose-1-phosphate uridylyltransferase n=1 Tax=Litorilinea aerophila TaxID=1204385 RepID=A0A540VHX7_9CHLR|nr:galactose-1-phosphate uridylyltransferase [Litorilinea aerophila]MCC9076003.1 galactose-1-phosphate uridylyltransferase [Litorilinea aerophila]
MSEFRQDPTTREWVLLAPERAKRPEDFPQHQRPMAPAWDPDCPFCPGNEQRTPEEETFRIGTHAGWQVRVVTNKYPALTPTGSLTRRHQGALFTRMDGVGIHEVSIETPDHARPLAEMEAVEVENVLVAYRTRYNALRHDPRLKIILIFRNQGKGAGTSLAHPHSQLIATPLVPPPIRRKHDVARAYYDDTGRCIYCDLREAEIAAGERLVFQSEHFTVLQPFAPQAPYETWILPNRHVAAFGDVADEELSDLAVVLRDTLRALTAQLQGLDFNYVIQTAPVGEAHLNYYLWHVQIVPRLTTPAGFELGSGISISTALPEETARLLRAQVRQRRLETED